jgi:hypothetical protein
VLDFLESQESLEGLAMNDAGTQAALSALRTILAYVAGYFTARGMLPTDQANELVGALMVLMPLGWGAWQKVSAEREAKARETVAVRAGVAAPMPTAAAMSVTPKQAQSIIQELTLQSIPSNGQGI